MAQTARSATLIVGRDRERVALLELLEEGGPLVAFVHGPAGVGKSALLGTFAAEARAAGAEVVRLDCRAFEPTEHGFLDAVRQALRPPTGDVADPAAALADLGPTVVLAIDTYEVFRVSDAWLRSVFVPALDERVRVVIAGREPPLPPGSTPGAPRGRSAACSSARSTTQTPSRSSGSPACRNRTRGP
jgi:predicted ATPase